MVLKYAELVFNALASRLVGDWLSKRNFTRLSLRAQTSGLPPLRQVSGVNHATLRGFVFGQARRQAMVSVSTPDCARNGFCQSGAPDQAPTALAALQREPAQGFLRHWRNQCWRRVNSR